MYAVGNTTIKAFGFVVGHHPVVATQTGDEVAVPRRCHSYQLQTLALCEEIRRRPCRLRRSRRHDHRACTHQRFRTKQLVDGEGRHEERTEYAHQILGVWRIGRVCIDRGVLVVGRWERLTMCGVVDDRRWSGPFRSHHQMRRRWPEPKHPPADRYICDRRLDHLTETPHRKTAPPVLLRREELPSTGSGAQWRRT